MPRQSKLTPAQLVEITRLRLSRKTIKAIARIVKCSPSQVKYYCRLEKIRLYQRDQKRKTRMKNLSKAWATSQETKRQIALAKAKEQLRAEIQAAKAEAQRAPIFRSGDTGKRE